MKKVLEIQQSLPLFSPFPKGLRSQRKSLLEFMSYYLIVYQHILVIVSLKKIQFIQSVAESLIWYILYF